MEKSSKHCTSPQWGEVQGSSSSRRAFIALAATAVFARPFAARAQLAPNRPIRIIVPFAPAGSSDVLARLLQSPLQQALGQTVSATGCRRLTRSAIM
jgi:hypothetical protein